MTLSPIVSGTKSEAGVLLKTYGDIKKLYEKIELYRFKHHMKKKKDG